MFASQNRPLSSCACGVYVLTIKKYISLLTHIATYEHTGITELVWAQPNQKISDLKQNLWVAGNRIWHVTGGFSNAINMRPTNVMFICTTRPIIPLPSSSQSQPENLRLIVWKCFIFHCQWSIAYTAWTLSRKYN